MDQQRSESVLHEGTNYRSPFTKVLALGYYDGPTNGLLQAGDEGPVYKFDVLDELWNPEDQDLRVFSLAPVPSNSLTELTSLYSQFLVPHWPLWVPLWDFPTKEIQQEMERVTEEALGRAGLIGWVIASTDLLGTVHAARAVSPEEFARITDWFSFLGIPGPVPTD
jgi:hypothetical protein